MTGNVVRPPWGLLPVARLPFILASPFIGALYPDEFPTGLLWTSGWFGRLLRYRRDTFFGRRIPNGRGVTWEHFVRGHHHSQRRLKVLAASSVADREAP